MKQSVIKTKHSQEFLESLTLRLYTQYSGLIVLSTVCLILLHTDAHSTDTGLKHSTPQTHLSTHPTLCSFAITILLCSRIHYSLSATQHKDSPLHDCPSLVVCWPVYAADCVSQTFYTVLFTAVYP